MRRFGESRLIRLVLCASMLCLACPFPALAQQPPNPAAQADSSLQEARELIKNGDYDRAIEILKAVIAEARSHVANLREAYLLLIKTHVFLGNNLKSQAQGRAASLLAYKAAREQIAECLRIKELRHTRPEPESEYPPEMISFFAEVRSELFGSFRVVGLKPPGATVVLDADTLRAMPGDSLLGDVDLAVGPHLVIVRQKGFKDVSEEITISPSSTLERNYELPKRRGGMWYATWTTGALGVLGGVVALTSGKGSSTTATPQPLPGPPGPPSN